MLLGTENWTHIQNVLTVDGQREMPDNVRPLTHAETAQRVGETLGSVLEDMRVRRDEIVAERDRLKAFNGELLAALEYAVEIIANSLFADEYDLSELDALIVRANKAASEA